MNCKICGSNAEQAFTGTILGRHKISYHYCSECGFLQTEEPYWLQEAYSSAINEIDLGPISRAVTAAKWTEGVIVTWFDPNAQFVDWGGGYGVFTRLMRDRGFDFHWRDPYCNNLFAQHFVASESANYELITCFEVFEHWANPLAEIEQMLKRSTNILFTTEIVPGGVKSQDDWWYFAPNAGQHISFYSINSLEHIAKRFSLSIVSNGRNIHLLSKKSISNRLFCMMLPDNLASKVARHVGRRKLRSQSLLEADFRSISGLKF